MHTLSTSLALVAGGILFGLACASDSTHAGPEAVPSPALPVVSGSLPSFAPLVEAVQPAVVHVFTSKKVDLSERFQGLPFFFGPHGMDDAPGEMIQRGQGSGFVISPDGEILTNNHVVEGVENVKVKFLDGRVLNAEVVGTDPRTDVALVRVKSETPLPPLSLGSSDGLRVGDWVVAFGNPLGFSHTVTAGIVSAKGRVIGATAYDDFIQTDAAINMGNSGGPLLDASGRVVGINTAIAGQGTSIAFAVPIDMVKEILQDLRTDGKVARGWLGIQMQAVDPDLAEALGVEGGKGALITQVYPDTPAARGGLETGDVVTSLDGEAVEDSNGLLHAVGRHRPSDTVAVTVVREGRSRDLRLTLAERPSEDDLDQGTFSVPEKKDAAPDTPAKTSGLSRLGITLQVQTLGQGIAGRKGTATRLVVSEVAVGGPAEDKLQEGDVVVEINRKPVSSLAEANAAVKAGDDVTLFLVENKGQTRFVAVRAQ
jgi:serine protease Do